MKIFSQISISFFFTLFSSFFLASTLSAAPLISDQRVMEIFQTYVKVNYTDEYKNRYVPFPFQKDKNPRWHWVDKELPRVIAVLEFEKFVNEHGFKSNFGLAINGKDPEWYNLPHKKVTIINYENDPKNADLHTLNLKDKNFDFVMVNQTLEHVYDPLRCLKNIYDHMAPGGIIYFNVPATGIQHSMPWHYYIGYTPVGIGVLAELAGFKILAIGQWGNMDYLQALFKDQYWPDYQTMLMKKVKEIGVNDVNIPIITWIFAIKD